MGKGKRRRKRNKVKAKAKAKQRRKQLPAGPTSVNDLPNELLDAVLLNLGSSTLHLIRAAATCWRWRRAIADPGFLASSRALHGAPPVAGRYYVTGSLPPKPAAFMPSSPAVVDAGHFSLDFLYVPPVEGDRPPRTRYYYNRPRRRTRHSRSREIVDSHGSLLLLTSRPWSDSIHCRRRSPDFIVCEPVSRRYQGIARPDDLSHAVFLGAFLQDGGGDGDAMSNFKVLSVLYERHFRPRYQFCTPRAGVFTPGSDGGWCWHTMDDDVEVLDMETIHFAGRSAGKVYWGTENSSMLVLDESTLKFSLLTFPAPMQWTYRSRTTSFRVIGGVYGGDKVRVVRMDGDALEVFGQLPDSGEWVIDRSISLRDATANLPGWEYWLFRLPASIATADNNFLVLTPGEKTWFISVDLETMEVDNEHVRNRDLGPSYPCTLPWPPVLRACVNHGNATGKRRHTRQRRRPLVRLAGNGVQSLWTK